jgi:hypothetical protein
MGVAKKARLEDFKLKVLIWGLPGGGKTRWALHSPKPLIMDTENSTLLYSNEFDFMRAKIDPNIPAQRDAVFLATTLLKEFGSNEYSDDLVETFVIDSVSDLLDNVESMLCRDYEKQLGKSVESLNQLQKTKWYAFRRDKTRDLLNKIIAIDKNIIFTARSKLKWENVNGQMTPVGVTNDCLEILEYLVDIVIFINEHGVIEVKKTRLTKETGIIENIKTFNDLLKIVKNKYEIT